MDENIIVTNIQRMCFSDGPGIRTTVFLKGCSLHCPWCSNPENISFGLQKYERNGLEAIYGEKYSTDDLMKLIVKDYKFWKSEGGVTFSGGEALLHAKKIENLLRKLHEMDVNIFFETSLFVPKQDIELILSYIDGAFVDVKILNRSDCMMYLGGNIDIYFENVEMLYRDGKIYKFRVPCSYEYTLTDENIQLMLNFFCKYKDVPIQLFSIHDLGRDKYATLNLKIWEHKKVELNDIVKLQAIFENYDLDVEIIQI